MTGRQRGETAALPQDGRLASTSGKDCEAAPQLRALKSPGNRLLRLVRCDQGAAVSPAHLGGRVSAFFSRTSHRPEAPLKSWDDLPDHLLEHILNHLQDPASQEWPQPKVLLAITSVCSTWRRIAMPLFFSSPWDSEKPIHPSQLLSLCPRPLLAPPESCGSDNRGMLCCFVRRETLAPGLLNTMHRFCLYLGEDIMDTSAKLLLCAEQTGRCSYTISTSRDVRIGAVAKLAGNLPRTLYSLLPNQSAWVRKALTPYGTDAYARNSPTLVRVSYQMRMKGIMLPRRVKVELPSPLSLMDSLLSSPGIAVIRSLDTQHDVPFLPAPHQELLHAQQAGALAAAPSVVLAPAAAALSPQQSARNPARQVIGPAQLKTMLSRTSYSAGSTVVAATPCSCSSSICCCAAARRFHISSGGESVSSADSDAVAASATAGPPVIKLHNKPPHWNERMRCWCLNFHGRVKVASVKNFQLICSGDKHGRVVMQFGKVDSSAFILDFNPCVLSPLQAFTICLTTFETKYLI